MNIMYWLIPWKSLNSWVQKLLTYIVHSIIDQQFVYGTVAYCYREGFLSYVTYYLYHLIWKQHHNSIQTVLCICQVRVLLEFHVLVVPVYTTGMYNNCTPVPPSDELCGISVDTGIRQLVVAFSLPGFRSIKLILLFGLIKICIWQWNRTTVKCIIIWDSFLYDSLLGCN